MLILFHRNRFKTNELVAKINLDEELKFDYNSLIVTSYPYYSVFQRNNTFVYYFLSIQFIF